MGDHGSEHLTEGSQAIMTSGDDRPEGQSSDSGNESAATASDTAWLDAASQRYGWVNPLAGSGAPEGPGVTAASGPPVVEPPPAASGLPEVPPLSAFSEPHVVAPVPLAPQVIESPTPQTPPRQHPVATPQQRVGTTDRPQAVTPTPAQRPARKGSGQAFVALLLAVTIMASGLVLEVSTLSLDSSIPPFAIGLVIFTASTVLAVAVYRMIDSVVQPLGVKLVRRGVILSGICAWFLTLVVPPSLFPDGQGPSDLGEAARWGLRHAMTEPTRWLGLGVFVVIALAVGWVGTGLGGSRRRTERVQSIRTVDVTRTERDARTGTTTHVVEVTSPHQDDLQDPFRRQAEAMRQAQARRAGGATSESSTDRQATLEELHSALRQRRDQVREDG